MKYGSLLEYLQGNIWFSVAQLLNDYDTLTLTFYLFNYLGI